MDEPKNPPVEGDVESNQVEEKPTSAPIKISITDSSADASADQSLAKPESTPEAEVEPEVEASPEAGTEVKPETEAETEAEPEVEAETPVEEPKAEIEPEAEAETEPEPAAEEVAPAEQPAVAEPVTSPEAPKRHSGLFIWLLLVLIIAAGGFAAWKYVFNKQPATNTNSATKAAVKKDVNLIRVGIVFPTPTEFYPADGDSSTTLDINGQLFEGLTGWQGGISITPVLATGWTNPDPSTWIFSLRHNVTFHDGNIMTAKQVKASLEQGAATDFGSSLGNTIKTVSVVDDYTVKVTTDGPDALLPNKLTYLKIFDTDSAKKNDASNGTGPFTVKSGTALNENTLDLVANDKYWGGHVYVRELQYKRYPDQNAVLADMKAGKVDLGSSLRETQLSELPSSQYNTIDDGNILVGQLVPNTLKGGPLANVKVRQAIWQALDPTALLKAFGRTGTAASQIVPSQIPGNDPELTRPKTDAAAAKAAIAAAGYPNGFSFKLSYFSPAIDKLAAEIQTELKAAGVTVVLDPQTDGPTLATNAYAGKYDMFYNSNSSYLLDASDVLSGYVRTKTYNSEPLNKLYDQVSQTLDPAKRLKLLQQMSDIVYDDKPTLPLYNLGDKSAIRKDIHLHAPIMELGGDPGVNFGKAYGQ